jgi:pimeloyl-ACP methyl ester carboxylesterase
MKRPEVVLVLHGLARTRRSVSGLERAIAAAGYPTWSASYPSRQMSVEKLAEDVAARVQAEAPAEVYSAVTHSLGGIVVRHLAGRLPWRRVVMLAPPNRGSRLALALRDHPLYRWFYGPAGRDVTEPERWPAPPSPFAVIAGTKSTSIGNPVSWVTTGAQFFPPDSPNDGTVSVAETQHPAMAAFATVPATHTLIMNHPRAQALAIAFLREGRFPDGVTPR